MTNSPPRIEERNGLPDLLKGLAIVFMVQVHLWELFASPQLSGIPAGRMGMFLGGPPVAPLFMIIFGYYVAAGGKSFKDQLLRGVKLFALGMLLNLLLNLNLVIHVMQGSLQVNVWPYIFGVDILHLAGLSMIVLATLIRIEKARTYLAAMLIVFVLLVSALLPADLREMDTHIVYPVSYFIGISHWSYFPLFPWMAYPLTGLILYDLKKSKIWPAINGTYTRWILTGIAAACICITFPYGVKTAAYLPAYYHHSFLFFGWTLLFLLAYSCLVEQLDLLAGKTQLFDWLRWMGRHVTLLYVIQWIIIGNMATALYRSVTSPGALFLYFTGILIACCLIAAVYIRIRKTLKAS